jgi:hypothetical protein
LVPWLTGTFASGAHVCPNRLCPAIVSFALEVENMGAIATMIR